ncbi:MAG: 3-isopropylmalate dehydratase large subunit [Candidatus Cloacimonetes bacterium]|nr:3-isopropylmalate dehydratase large subunit [Candidatus Cloacimonadota bacterium]
MGLTLLEKILVNHSNKSTVKPGEIVDIFIDARVARDFGGANVVKNMRNNNLTLADPKLTMFTFDCNPGGSDQKYAVNQQICRVYARENSLKVYDINSGIGTHILMDEGLAYSGSTAVSTDSHANILGAVGAFGQGMGDQDIAAAWANGKVWFKVPASIKITLNGRRPVNVSAKDIALNLLAEFGANSLLGYSVEIYGTDVDKLTLDERITISSMATEMGCIAILFTPSAEIMKFSEKMSGKKLELVQADADAVYEKELELDFGSFSPRAARPGKPHDTIPVTELDKIKIDSAFIGSCTNGRIEDLRAAAAILKGRKVAPGVVLKIVPATDEVWNIALAEGLIKIFKDAEALVGNAGCAGCAAGQIGQNGEGEITISTGNRNFPGKQGKGSVYLAAPATVAASAVAGYITTPDRIPEIPAIFTAPEHKEGLAVAKKEKKCVDKPTMVEGRVWFIKEDNIDTDMIFHNRYLTITDLAEMGQYTFDNLAGYNDFAKKAKTGDIVVVQKNFGSGSSRQQAVDCFKSLGIQAILAESYGSIYERNAINAAFPIITYKDIRPLELSDGDVINVDFISGIVKNLRNGKTIQAEPFSEVQMEIYHKNGIFG